MSLEEELAFAGVLGSAGAAALGTRRAPRSCSTISLARIQRLRRQAQRLPDAAPDGSRRSRRGRPGARARRRAAAPRCPGGGQGLVRGGGPRSPLGTGSPEPLARADAEVVRRLRAAGAVVVGTTHLPELALWPFTESATHGTTRNPWDPTRTPGGSSGGSAAAVASGMVAAALASDGGGSIRIPAACTGLVGLKATRDLVPLAPHHEHWYGLSVAGVLTRTAADQAAVLEVLQDTPLPLSVPRPVRVAWSVSPLTPVPWRPRSRRPSTPPPGTSTASATTWCTRTRTARGSPSRSSSATPRARRRTWPGSRTHGPRSCRTRAVAALGRRLAGAPLNRARRLGDTASVHGPRLPGCADVLLTPTLPGTADRAGALTGLRTLVLAGRRAGFTSAWNATGQPAVSVPVGLSDGGPSPGRPAGRRPRERRAAARSRGTARAGRRPASPARLPPRVVSPP